MIRQYDHIRLKSGEHAVIVEIWKQGISCEANVEIEPGDYETKTIKHSDIESVFVEVETPLESVV